MSENDDGLNNADDNSAAADAAGSFLDLNFVPEWARRAPDQIHYSDEAGNSRHDRRDRKGRGRDRHGMSRGDDRERRPRREERRRPQNTDGASEPRSPDSRPGGRRQYPSGPSAHGGAYERAAVPEIPDMPLRVSFIPEQRQLNALVKQLVASQRAYPLMQLPKVFTEKPDTCCAKLEVEDAAALKLFQCRVCGAVARRSDMLLAHLVRRHMTEFCEEVEIETEAPSGQFPCVARCGLSGEWIGPPNHHSYNERMEEIRSAQYPHLSQEAYRAKVETLRDDESIEAWRQSCRLRKSYRFAVPGKEPTEAMPWSEASAYFLEHFAASKMRSVSRAIVPLGICRELEDEELREYIRREWSIERRRPRSLMFALRVALRHKRLHFFRIGRGHEFVSAVVPVPLDSKHAVDNIREVLEFLREHPGCNRKDLLENLRPGVAPNDSAAGEVLNPLRWLGERGHIIEFFDGTLAVALQGGAKK